MISDEMPVQSLPTPDLEAEATAPKKVPGRSNRYRLFDDGGGDYRIYRLMSATSGEIPKGSLVPLPGAPGFMATAEAKKWLRVNAEKLNGMQVMIFRGLEIMRISVVARPTVNLESKPRTRVTEAAAASDDKE